MKKSILSLIPTATGMVVGWFLIWCLTIVISLDMTYKKNTISVAGTDYVSEVTQWTGHKHIVNIPVWYGKLNNSSYNQKKEYKIIIVLGYLCLNPSTPVVCEDIIQVCHRREYLFEFLLKSNYFRERLVLNIK